MVTPARPIDQPSGKAAYGQMGWSTVRLEIVYTK
jgi:hypothetical protein